MKKLSKTMQEAYDKMLVADWYYMHDGKTCDYFANENGFRRIGFEGAAIVEGGHVYSQLSSSTLKALGDRGLVEVTHDGKRSLDAVKVVDMELPERLTKAIMVKVVRRFLDRPEWGPQEFIGYVTSEAATKFLVERFQGPNAEAEATVIGEVELSVWDFFKNK